MRKKHINIFIQILCCIVLFNFFICCDSNEESLLFENKIKEIGEAYECNNISYTTKRNFKSKNIYVTFFETKKLNPFNDSNVYVNIPVIINNLYPKMESIQESLDTLFILFENESIIETKIPLEEIYAIIGLKFFSKESYTKSIESFSKSILLNSKNVNYYINRAIAYYKTEQFIKSYKDFEKALVIDPNNAKASDGLNRIEKKGKLEKE